MGNIDVSLNRERNISEFSGKEQKRTDCFPKETINYKPTGTTCKEIWQQNYSYNSYPCTKNEQINQNWNKNDNEQYMYSTLWTIPSNLQYKK